MIDIENETCLKIIFEFFNKLVNWYTVKKNNLHLEKYILLNLILEKLKMVDIR